MTVLVTGSLGYIGGHVALALKDSGYDARGVDNLSTAVNIKGAIPSYLNGVENIAQMESIMRATGTKTIIHLAAKKSVPESIANPLMYYEENVRNTYMLFQAAAKCGVENFIFSSSAAVYGEPEESDGYVTEWQDTNPINPYGRSKLMAEQILADLRNVNGMRVAMLRYFNVIGADEKGRWGDHRGGSANLMGAIIKAAKAKKPFVINGDAYDTPDGTAVRDFIHVTELADAHVGVMELMVNSPEHFTNYPQIMNVGTGQGFSVQEVVDTALDCGLEFDVRIGPSRKGDPASVVADVGRYDRLIGYEREFTLEEMVRSSIEWENKKDA